LIVRATSAFFAAIIKVFGNITLDTRLLVPEHIFRALANPSLFNVISSSRARLTFIGSGVVILVDGTGHTFLTIEKGSFFRAEGTFLQDRVIELWVRA